MAFSGTSNFIGTVVSGWDVEIDNDGRWVFKITGEPIEDTGNVEPDNRPEIVQGVRN